MSPVNAASLATNLLVQDVKTLKLHMLSGAKLRLFKMEVAINGFSHTNLLLFFLKLSWNNFRLGGNGEKTCPKLQCRDPGNEFLPML